MAQLPVEKRLISDLQSKKRCLLFVLLDSEASDSKTAAKLARQAETAGASALLVGGSTAADQIELAGAVKALKRSSKLPVILFPGNVTGIAPGADAILFSSLMNSENPYYITQAQALGAPSVLKSGLEPLPTAYLIIGEGTAAWFVGAARGIPFDKPKIAAAYALAARFLGMRFAYLEAGSGASSTVRPEMVRAVKKAFGGFLIVGGGIRDAKTAGQIAAAGADAIVIGTMLEERGQPAGRLEAISKALKAAGR